MNESDEMALVGLLMAYKTSDSASPIVLTEGNWKIAEGAYDLYFELYYGENQIPVAECIAGEVNVNFCGILSDEDKLYVFNAILEILDYLKKEDD